MLLTFVMARRRIVGVLGAASALLAGGVMASAPAVADTSSTLTVVGTSDVFDSNLVQTVIKPGFEATHPGVTLNYVSKGTGAAIQYAEQGAASALIVHAASLENQFVGSGYSSEQYGRAIFWGDYVLLGPNSDPVRVSNQAAHNIAKAFQLVAAAGAQGHANFVSRGGTPGTTVQEHAIWALTTGVTTCDVSDVNGGGESPSTVTGPCPASIPYPSWYHATGLTQGPNIVNADTCNYSGGNCYVLTDRGTFNYLQSQGGAGGAQDLKIVTRDNSPNAPGGVPLLVNSFHAYSVNPAAFPPDVAAGINQTAALQFLDWIQSPAAQQAIGQYLNGTNDPPFLPDAAPKITATAPPAITTGGKPIAIRGKVTNVVPGTPALAGKTVLLYGTDNSASPVTTQVATTTTDSNGNYVFNFTPRASRTYTVRTEQISQIENADLTPVFGDLLAPGSVTAGSNVVKGAPTVTSATPSTGALRVVGTLRPPAFTSNAQVVLYATPTGGDEFAVCSIPVTSGQVNFAKKCRIAAGDYSYRIGYSDGVYISQGFSPSGTVTIP